MLSEIESKVLEMEHHLRESIKAHANMFEHGNRATREIEKLSLANRTRFRREAEHKIACISRYKTRYSHLQSNVNNCTSYSVIGPYHIHNIDKFDDLFNTDVIKMKGGFPRVLQANKQGESNWEFNPVTVAQVALMLFGRHRVYKEPVDAFFRVTNALLEHMQPDGALPYNYEWKYYDIWIEPGWVSGMAQGHALNVFTRAYLLTDNVAYLDAAIKAFECMHCSLENGGTKSSFYSLSSALESYTCIEEYPFGNASYTLNGWIFSLIGLYDFLLVSPDSHYEIVNQDLLNGLYTLQAVLPLYDLKHISTYDLTHYFGKSSPNLNLGYHEAHVRQLYVLFSLSGITEFKHTAESWCRRIDAND